MEVGKLNAEFRTNQGKTASRRLKAAGKIPAVCYGGEKADGSKEEPILLSLDPKALAQALDPVKRTNTVITLAVAGAPKGQEQLTVMVRDFQRDAIRGQLTHADFVRVRLDRDVRAVIPLIYTGKAEGLKKGGILHQNLRALTISCTPDKIPAKIEIDITALDMGDALHVSDIKLGAGIRALEGANATVCSVTAPKAEKVAEAAPVEGAVAAEGAAAAPAAGAEAGKAAAPAAAGAKAAAPAAGDKGGDKGGDKDKKGK